MRNWTTTALLALVCVTACGDSEGSPDASPSDADPQAIDAGPADARVSQGVTCADPNVCTCPTGVTCVYDCVSGSACQMQCNHVSSCDTACTGTDDCTVNCQPASQCIVDCNESCTVSCGVNGCEVKDCPAETCTVTCEGGAPPNREGDSAICE